MKKVIVKYKFVDYKVVRGPLYKAFRDDTDTIVFHVVLFVRS